MMALWTQAEVLILDSKGGKRKRERVKSYGFNYFSYIQCTWMMEHEGMQELEK